MTFSSLLTDGLDFDAIEKAKREQAQLLGKVSASIEIHLASYEEGYLSFHRFAASVRTALNVLGDENQHQRHALLGEAIEAALLMTPKKLSRGKKGISPRARETAIDILKMVRERESRPLTRLPGNAFERVCEIMTEAGYPGVSATELEKWWGRRSRTRE